MTRECETSTRQLREEAAAARARLDGAREDLRREAHVADIVNTRAKDAMSKLADDNLQLRRELGRLSFPTEAAMGLRQRAGGGGGGGVSELAIADGVAIDPADADLGVDDYVVAGAHSEYQYLAGAGGHSPRGGRRARKSFGSSNGVIQGSGGSDVEGEGKP